MFLLFEAEPVSGGIEQPGVVVGALHARVESKRLSGELPSRQRARIGQRAVGLALNVALLLPLRVVPQRVDVHGVLHPLNHLQKHMKGEREMSFGFVTTQLAIRPFNPDA